MFSMRTRKQRHTEKWREQQPARFELNEYQEWDEETEWEEEDDRFVDQSRIVDLWSRIERHRKAIAEQEARFQRWLQWSPELRKHWQAFLDAGGISAEDYDRFCKGTMRHRLIRAKRGLRLVRTNRKTKRVTRWQEPGDDAA